MAMELRIQLRHALVVLVTVIRPHPIQRHILAALAAETEQDLPQRPVLLVAERKCLPILIARTL